MIYRLNLPIYVYICIYMVIRHFVCRYFYIDMYFIYLYIYIQIDLMYLFIHRQIYRLFL